MEEFFAYRWILFPRTKISSIWAGETSNVPVLFRTLRYVCAGLAINSVVVLEVWKNLHQISGECSAINYSSKWSLTQPEIAVERTVITFGQEALYTEEEVTSSIYLNRLPKLSKCQKYIGKIEINSWRAGRAGLDRCVSGAGVWNSERGSALTLGVPWLHWGLPMGRPQIWKRLL